MKQEYRMYVTIGQSQSNIVNLCEKLEKEKQTQEKMLEILEKKREAREKYHELLKEKREKE